METFLLILLALVTAPFWFPCLIILGMMLGLLIATPIVVIAEVLGEMGRKR